MENIFIWYSKCSTCQKAKKWLEDNNIAYTERSIIDDTPNKDELAKWTSDLKVDIKKLFNTSGLKYRELNLKEKLPNMTDEEKIKLLSTDGMLIKRPLLVSSSIILIGFKEQEWEQLKRVNL